MTENSQRLERALISLDGLSVGDAFGSWAEMKRDRAIARRVKARTLPGPPWRWTDDTNMALSIVSVLRQSGRIDQDALALSFAMRYEGGRGYGTGAHFLLTLLRIGQPWQQLSKAIFDGGSWGNGGAMRVAPLGAYFADDLPAAVENARLSAEVTHAHPEGIAGAVAIAAGAAVAAQAYGNSAPDRRAFIDAVLPHVPAGQVRDGLVRARDLPPGTDVIDAVRALGNGSHVSAQDTVPYALWCAGEKFDNYEEALWLTISGGGDTDTTCAMVGGIVAAHTGREGIPSEWLDRRETLPAWHLKE